MAGKKEGRKEGRKEERKDRTIRHKALGSFGILHSILRRVLRFSICQMLNVKCER
jgi:hypothetical protein